MLPLPPLAWFRRQLDAATPAGVSHILAILAADPRAGALALAESARRKLDRASLESRRLSRLLAPERRLWRAGHARVAGVDEVGVGPLAGPVVAAAVILPVGVAIPGVDDSKKLSAAQRQRLAPLIRERALGVGLGIAEPGEIDRLNVYHAALVAMRRAVAALVPQPDQLLVDARRVPNIDIPQTAIVGGDGLSHAIACASIVAKVARDAIMDELAARHPGYGFERHKGYGTAQHLAALRRLGPSPAHRLSYAPVAAARR